MLRRRTPLERLARRCVKPRQPKPPGITARLRAAKRRRQQREDHEVYEQVDLRDGKTSRVSGIYCGDAIHRHHIVPRSLGGETTLANVISLTPDEHLVQIHQEATMRLSGDANKRCESGALCGVTIERHDGECWRVEGRC